MSGKLILCQVAFAIACQKKGGHFLIKCLTHLQFSLDIIYLLSCLYKQVSYLKPHTSRSANLKNILYVKDFKWIIRNLVISLYHNSKL